MFLTLAAAVVAAGQSHVGDLDAEGRQHLEPCAQRERDLVADLVGVNLLAGVAQQPRLNQRDGFHPNAQGVAVIAQGLAPVLVKALSGRRA